MCIVDAVGTSFKSADLKGARFYRANLNEADFTNADLSTASLEDTSLVDADLTNAILNVSRSASLISFPTDITIVLHTCLCALLLGCLSLWLYPRR